MMQKDQELNMSETPSSPELAFDIATPSHPEWHRLKFPYRLFHLLNLMEFKGLGHLAHWDEKGTCFQIRKSNEVVQHILPYFFQQRKWKSFQRQMNIYDFQRIKSGPYKGYYCHPYFSRSDMSQAHKIQRKKQRSEISDHGTRNEEARGDGDFSLRCDSSDLPLGSTTTSYETTGGGCFLLPPPKKTMTTGEFLLQEGEAPVGVTTTPQIAILQQQIKKWQEVSAFPLVAVPNTTNTAAKEESGGWFRGGTVLATKQQDMLLSRFPLFLPSVLCTEPPAGTAEQGNDASSSFPSCFFTSTILSSKKKNGISGTLCSDDLSIFESLDWSFAGESLLAQDQNNEDPLALGGDDEESVATIDDISGLATLLEKEEENEMIFFHQHEPQQELLGGAFLHRHPGDVLSI